MLTDDTHWREPHFPNGRPLVEEMGIEASDGSWRVEGHRLCKRRPGVLDECYTVWTERDRVELRHPRYPPLAGFLRRSLPAAHRPRLRLNRPIARHGPRAAGADAFLSPGATRVGAPLETPNVQWLLYLLTLASGLLTPVQSGLTGALDKALGRPFLVAVVSLAGSLVCAVTGALVTGQLGWPKEKAAEAPWWAWLAGLAGLVVLIARPYAARPLGAAVFTGLTVTASVVFSVLLDHYGLLGFQQHAAGWGRIAGAALMCAGVLLVSLT